MAKLFHQELSDDLDPQTVHLEFMTGFRRLDHDPDKYVVFVYPDSSNE